MLPSELTAQSFAAYPPEARQLASENLELLRAFPIAFLPLLLREAIAYDWKFPAERAELDRQFAYLKSLAAPERTRILQPFASLQISPDLAHTDWINDPAGFSERLSAYLWSSHQMDAFRAASVEYIHGVNVSNPEPAPALRRLSVLIVGRDVHDNAYPLFRKLRSSGVHFTNVLPESGVESVLRGLVARSQSHPARFAHWYIDGGDSAPALPQTVTTIAYGELAPVRSALIAKMTATMRPGGGGPELLRTQLAHLTPSEVGLGSEDPVLSRFKVSLLTEGSGTQIFSTTFVQWAARECLRRAQPLTLVARFAPRQKEAAVLPLQKAVAVDPEGSLIDADMAAYYTWINQQRLPGADHSRMLVWFEGHSEALAIAPGLKPGTTEESGFSIQELLSRLG